MMSHGESLARFLERAGRVAVVTGAGVSTASGIPEYRDREGNWKHPQPVQFTDFVNSAAVRRRYWARSFSGWRRISTASPNSAHEALAELEVTAHLDTLITQNVDGLHGSAGSRSVIDLHGRLDAVLCLTCDWRSSRHDWQQRLAEANPEWHAAVSETRPDGDAVLGHAGDREFQVPCCPNCPGGDGVVKPDVVFFGESVPKTRVQQATDAVRRASALLVVGSSLMVFSGFRFARMALEIDKPIAIVNQGRTRADKFAELKLEGDCGNVLQAAIRHLGAGPNVSGQGP